MVKLCNQCNCELNSKNAAKKDARRFRNICRSCFSKKRNQSRLIRLNNQTEHLNSLIKQRIIAIDFIDKDNNSEKCYECESPDIEFGLMVRGINCIKNFIARIYDGI